MSQRSKSTPKEILALCSSVGDFIQVWGFKKIHGQIWALLYLSNDPLTPTDIAKKLSVSKALVTITLNTLEKFDLIQSKKMHNDKKKKYFSATLNAFSAITKVLRSREQVILNQASLNHQKLGSALSLHETTHSNLCVDRYMMMGMMIEGARTALNSVLERSSVETAFFENVKSFV